MQSIFDRTTCACERCRDCCKRQPGPLAPGDFEKIAEHLGLTTDEAKKFFVASPGALAKTAEGQTFRVGTITPDFRKGRCVFLDENERCKIHAVAPYGCSHFDTHMGYAQGQARSCHLVNLQHTDREYKKLRDELPYAQHYKPRR